MISVLKKLIPNFILKFSKSSLFYFKHLCPTFLARECSLPSEVLEAKNLTLMIGHSNYLTAQGGTEKIIVETVEDMLANDENSLFIYPQGKSPFLLYFKPRTFGLILNGFEIATIRRNELRSFTKQISGQTQKVTVFHWLFWPMWDLKKMLVSLRELKKPITIQINDFYFHCPKVNYFCHAGVKMCGKSFYKGLISWWRKAQNGILSIADLISVPSEFMRKKIPTVFLSKAKLNAPNKTIIDIIEKKRLAYLGAASPIKGINTWLKLANNALVSRTFDLYQFGTEKPTFDTVSYLRYSYKESRSKSASTYLADQKIEYVLLWSEVPESYSFTLFEALAAGAKVLTSASSGNIAHQVSNSDIKGNVFESEYELVQFLLKLRG